jgi:hypothetical protein
MPHKYVAISSTAKNWFGDFWNACEVTKNKIAFKNAGSALN